jgi:hypothetical protein
MEYLFLISLTARQGIFLVRMTNGIGSSRRTSRAFPKKENVTDRVCSRIRPLGITTERCVSPPFSSGCGLWHDKGQGSDASPVSTIEEASRFMTQKGVKKSAVMSSTAKLTALKEMPWIWRQQGEE